MMVRFEYIYKCSEGKATHTDTIEIPCKDHTYLREVYNLYGESMPEKLKGSFAFALYDSINDRAFCARDPLGLAPLYYIETDTGYHFASNIDALLALPQVSKKPNLHSMSTMMQCFAVEYHDTMYQGIYRLPPGHRMSIENGKKRIERYWFPEKIEINYRISEEEAAQKLKALFGRAVDESISTLEETAFELSGGLDSSSVVSLLAKKVDASRIDSYSMSFEELTCDEGAYIDAFLAEYPLHHRKIPVGKLDYRDAYSLESLYALSPNWPISLTFAMLVPMLARMKQDGKKVVVTGQGGDHLFTGTPYVLYDLFVRGKFTAFYKELRSYRCPWNAFKAYALRSILGEQSVDKIKKILRKEQKEKSFWDRCSIKDLSEQAGIKNPAFRSDLDAVTTAYHSTVMDGNIFHCAENYFGIAYRHPFFDRELVEFALSLPPDMKYGNRTIKRILRKAMQGVLPEKINCRRDKAEFSEVIDQQIDAVDLDALFEDPYLVTLGLLTHADIEQCREAYRSKQPGYVSYLWTMINVEYWYRSNRFEEEKRRRKAAMIHAHHFYFADQSLLQREYESFGFETKEESSANTIRVEEIWSYDGFECRTVLRYLSGRASYYLSNTFFEKIGKDEDWGLEIVDVLTLVWDSKNRKILYGKGENFTPTLLQFWIFHTFFPIVLELQETYKMLHVGAVEVAGGSILFAAPSFGGKSTLTDFFIRKGHTLYSDDTLAVSIEEGSYIAYPSFPYHRPYRDPKHSDIVQKTSPDTRLQSRHSLSWKASPRMQPSRYRSKRVFRDSKLFFTAALLNFLLGKKSALTILQKWHCRYRYTKSPSPGIKKDYPKCMLR